MVSTPAEGFTPTPRPAAPPGDVPVPEVVPADSEEPKNYLNVSYGVRSWLFTLDHKRIAMLYLLTVSLMFVVGGIAAGLVRLNLLQPNGFLISAETYNKAFSAHGIVMVFFFIIPAIPAILGNFFIPMMLGAKDLAFPKINLLSWYLYIIGALMVLGALACGGVQTGWTFYAPLSSQYTNGPIVVVALGVFIAGFSSILTGLNFIVTTHKMRAPGLTWFRLPLFVWGLYATSLIANSGHAGRGHHDSVVGRRNHFQCRRVRCLDRRRPGAVSAFVLVLLASGGLHHDLAGHGGHFRSRDVLFAQADFWIPLHRFFQYGDCDSQLSGVGTSYVHHRPVAAVEHRVFGDFVLGGDSFGH